MNTFLVQHLRKKRELYDNDESVKIVIRVVGNDRKKMNISTGIEVRFDNWIQNWKKTHNKNPISKLEPDSQQKNLVLKSKLKEIENIVFDIEKEGLDPTSDLIKSRMKSHKRNW